MADFQPPPPPGDDEPAGVARWVLETLALLCVGALVLAWRLAAALGRAVASLLR